MPIRRTFTQIKNDGKNRLSTYTPINNFSETSVAGSMLDMIALESQELYNEIDYIHKVLDPTRNYGKELDNIGYLVGVKRSESVLAVDDSDTNFYFFIDRRLNMSAAQLLEKVYPLNTHFNIRERLFNGGLINDITNPTQIIIPRGTMIYNNTKSISYSTTKPAVIGNGDGFTGIIANVEGSASNVQANVLVKHNLAQNNLVQYLARYILCSNNFPISNGTNGMTDAEYRYQISLRPQNYNNNEVAIRQMALSVPGVRNILYERSKYGYGTVGIIVEGTSPLVSDGLVSALQTRLQAISGGDVITVNRPEYRGIEISLNVITEIGSDINSTVENVRTRIIDYVNNIPLGGTIIWNEIVSIIMNTTGVKDFINDYFMIGEYDPYNKLNKKRVVLREVNQRSYNTEKFYTDKGLIKVCSRQG